MLNLNGPELQSTPSRFSRTNNQEMGVNLNNLNQCLINADSRIIFDFHKWANYWMKMNIMHIHLHCFVIFHHNFAPIKVTFEYWNIKSTFADFDYLIFRVDYRFLKDSWWKSTSCFNTKNMCIWFLDMDACVCRQRINIPWW